MGINRLWVGLLLLLGLATLSVSASAQSVALYVDTAPNVFGGAGFDTWWEAAKTAVLDETFVTMSNGVYSGEWWADPYEEIVYSTGDKGRRVHWVFWIPGWVPEVDLDGAPILDGRLEVKMMVDWGGVDWSWDADAGEIAENTDLIGWGPPTHRVEIINDGDNQGVIGTFGWAWWANDDNAEPLNTNDSPFDETDQDDIDALREESLLMQTFALGLVRYTDGEGTSETFQLLVEIPYCDDGAINGTEICDDGLDLNGLYDQCANDCTGMGDFCGDSEVNGPEECDPEDSGSSAGCTQMCVVAGDVDGDVGSDLDMGFDADDIGDNDLTGVDADTDGSAGDLIDDVEADTSPVDTGGSADSGSADQGQPDTTTTTDLSADGSTDISGDVPSFPPQPQAPDDGCGVAAGSGAGASWVVGLFMGVWLLRRRRS